jgi:hypothetical protein
VTTAFGGKANACVLFEIEPLAGIVALRRQDPRIYREKDVGLVLALLQGQGGVRGLNPSIHFPETSSTQLSLHENRLDNKMLTI